MLSGFPEGSVGSVSPRPQGALALPAALKVPMSPNSFASIKAFARAAAADDRGSAELEGAGAEA